VIRSRKNSYLKDIRRLRRSKGDEVLLEGPHLLGEALDAGLRLGTVLATPDFLAGREGRRLALRLPRPPLAVEAALLEEVSDSDSPRGVVAVASLPRRGVEALGVRRGGIYLYLEGVQDPGNLGALARVAEASGVAGPALGAGTVHPNHPRAQRAAAGSLLRLPLAVHVSPTDLDAHLAAVAPRWTALVPRGGLDLYEADLDGALVLALGAEGPGLSEATQERATIRLTVGVDEPVESLNVTVAAAVVLFELRRRRRR
jgi:TrmH family RNA methyltransferase